MASHELMLLVDALAEDQEDALIDGYDAVVNSHAAGTIVALAADGPSAQVAARNVIVAMQDLGVRVNRLVEDLVTRSMIAERAHVTPQAVGQWIRGERQGRDFPRPYTVAGGGLWLWSEVNRWLRTLDDDLGDGLCHPDLVDYTEINHWLLHRWTVIPQAVAVRSSIVSSVVETGPVVAGLHRETGVRFMRLGPKVLAG